MQKKKKIPTAPFSFFPSILSISLIYSYSTPPTPPSKPLPRVFSTPCHTWTPPAHYALFCVMPVDTVARSIWTTSIHLRMTHSSSSFFFFYQICFISPCPLLLLHVLQTSITIIPSIFFLSDSRGGWVDHLYRGTSTKFGIDLP